MCVTLLCSLENWLNLMCPLQASQVSKNVMSPLCKSPMEKAPHLWDNKLISFLFKFKYSKNIVQHILKSSKLFSTVNPFILTHLYNTLYFIIACGKINQWQITKRLISITWAGNVSFVLEDLLHDTYLLYLSKYLWSRFIDTNYNNII